MMLRAQIKTSNSNFHTLYSPINYLQNYLSLYRGWKMFAPNPLRFNVFVEAKIEFHDKSSMYWKFRRPSEFSILKKLFLKDRLRKYVTDSLRLDKKRHLHRRIAIYIKSKVFKKTNKKIKKISLYRKWQKIPDWNKSFIPHLKEPSSPYRANKFYEKEFND